MRRPDLDHATWHVTARGARRLLLFHDDADYKVFYAMLGESCRHSGMDLVADCLMSNHFHLSLGGGSVPLTDCMTRLNRAYSGYHNERYGLSGHAFEQRYYGEPVPSDFILKRVVRYIHLNPVRGGKVGRPEEYPWSSYRRLAFSTGTPLGKGESAFLELFSENVREAQQEYRSFTESDLLRPILPIIGRTVASELWQEQFRWILEQVRSQALFLAPLGTEEVAVHLGSRAGIPPRIMGRVLNHPDGRVVSEMKRQFNRRLEQAPASRQKIDALGIL